MPLKRRRLGWTRRSGGTEIIAAKRRTDDEICMPNGSVAGMKTTGGGTEENVVGRQSTTGTTITIVTEAVVFMPA
jgi:hypothetical protein